MLGLAGQCKTQGLSGRALRRLPVLALARYIGVGQVFPSISTSMAPKKPAAASQTIGTPVEVWLNGMEKVIQEQQKELEKLV